MQKRSLLYIGNKLSKKGATASSIDTLSLLLEEEGFKVYIASSVKNKVVRFLDMLCSTFLKARKVSFVLIDTYSTQNFYYAVAIAKLCRLLKAPYIPILHGGNLALRLSNNPKVSRKLFSGAKYCVSPSLFLLDVFKEAGINNVHYIPNSIEIKDYSFLLRKNLQPKLLWVRSFADIYNPLLAIEVILKLKSQGINASLTMVGPDKDGSLVKCKSEAEKHKLDVIFTGKLEKTDWISLSKTCDIFINTTTIDNTPISLIEAMALGLPIISTNVGGIPYLIEDSKTGILVSPNDKNVFAAAICHLLSNPLLAESLSRNARSKAETFDWQKVKESWLALIG